jgi:predicted TIM-barrel fold metal-dependent hydrolase
MFETPKIISVDDHIVEPPQLWQDRLPAKFKDRGPRVERHFGRLDWNTGGRMDFVDTASDEPGSRWSDHWVYDDLRWPVPAGFAAVGPVRDLEAMTPICYDDMLPGCHDQTARLADMDLNHVEASLCFPTFPRFCGQTFTERADKELAHLCVRAYNDWMIDDWCAGPGYGRLIPLTLVPLWDAELAAAEVRRCADKGSRAVTFSEIPPFLGLPSIHSGYWDPMFAACEETETVVNMHVGSASKLTTTSADAPIAVWAALTVQNAQAGLVDWLCSGVLARFPTLRIAFSEGQVGWMPFMLERLDSIWERSEVYEKGMRDRIPERPGSYIDRVYGCIFDDVHGLINRDLVGGLRQIMFETDYPHADSAFPNSRQTAEKLISAAGLNEHEAWQFVRGSAIDCYNLGRFGITA